MLSDLEKGTESIRISLNRYFYLSFEDHFKVIPKMAISQ
jgi:hypothetical protein